MLTVNIQAKSAAPWFLLVITLFIFLAPNVDLAKHLAWHDGQRLAEVIMLNTVVVLLLRVQGSAAGVHSEWLSTSVAIRRALVCAFGLGALSSLLVP